MERAAEVDGAVVAKAYGTLEALMDAIGEAEASGDCPVHPPAVPW